MICHLEVHLDSTNAFVLFQSGLRPGHGTGAASTISTDDFLQLVHILVKVPDLILIISGASFAIIDKKKRCCMALLNGKGNTSYLSSLTHLGKCFVYSKTSHEKVAIPPDQGASKLSGEIVNLG